MSKIRIKGAGIQGLTCAWALRDHSPELYEAKSVPGGWIQTRVIDNFLFELGPRGFRPKGDGLCTLQLIRELGLEDELIAPPRIGFNSLHLSEWTAPGAAALF